MILKILLIVISSITFTTLIVGISMYFANPKATTDFINSHFPWLAELISSWLNEDSEE